jgi:hypothetical protein
VVIESPGADGGDGCRHDVLEGPGWALGIVAASATASLPNRRNPPRPVTGALTAKGVLERSGGAAFAQGEPAGASDGVGRRAGWRW